VIFGSNPAALRVTEGGALPHTFWFDGPLVSDPVTIFVDGGKNLILAGGIKAEIFGYLLDRCDTELSRARHTASSSPPPS
jgi:hypothetical protein